LKKKLWEGKRPRIRERSLVRGRKKGKRKASKDCLSVRGVKRETGKGVGGPKKRGSPKGRHAREIDLNQWVHDQVTSGGEASAPNFTWGGCGEASPGRPITRRDPMCRLMSGKNCRETSKDKREKEQWMVQGKVNQGWKPPVRWKKGKPSKREGPLSTT